MQEDGIDITSQKSKSLEELKGQHFDYVMTVCDRARERSMCTMAKIFPCILVSMIQPRL